MSKKSKVDLGPLDFMIDLAGAAVMRSVTKNKIIKDYKRGQGEASIKAAMLVHGSGALRRGSDGIVSLGGVYGINSALKEIERQEAAAATARRAQADSIPVYSAPANDNSEAWRLNTAEGKSYGLDPNDYDTREEYLSDLNELKAFKSGLEKSNRPASDVETTIPCAGKVHVYCKVSLLNNGKNRYYLADEIKVSVGDSVKVLDGGTEVTGIVLTVEQHSVVTAPLDPEDITQIISLA